MFKYNCSKNIYLNTHEVLWFIQHDYLLNKFFYLFFYFYFYYFDVPIRFSTVSFVLICPFLEHSYVLIVLRTTSSVNTIIHDVYFSCFTYYTFLQIILFTVSCLFYYLGYKKVKILKLYIFSVNDILNVCC